MLQFRRYAVLAAASGLAVVAADAARAADAAAAAPASAVDEVIVTGTRSTSRTVTTSLAPIDVLSAPALEKSGKQSTRDLISTLVPSANTSNSGAGASFALKTVSLRGLAGDQTLVLVNGKRRHNTSIIFVNGTTQNGQSPPDLDLIPSTSIQRIEVLRDGASAQYGSDALAGVVNIILKDSPSGGMGQLLSGRTYYGDGATVQAALNHGFGGERGFLNITLDAKTTNLVDRGNHSPNTSVLYFPLAPGVPDPREKTANRHTAHPGAPQVLLYDASYNAAFNLTPDIRLYSFGTASSRNSAAWLTFRLPTGSGNNINVYPDGYAPRLFLHDRDFQFAWGVKGGNTAGFNWDLSTTYGQNENGFYENSLNASLGPRSPTHFYIGTLKFKEWTTNLDVNREFDLGLYKPTFVAAGAEYRSDELDIVAGQPESYIDGGYRAPVGQPLAGVVTVGGSQGVSGFPPFAAGAFSRDNKSVYVDVEQALAKSFEVSLAGRYEDYSDFGSAKTWKVSARWEPIENYAVRATASSGFRAPSLQQEHYASSSTIGVAIGGVTQLYPVQLLPSDNPAAIALGAKPLEPETSRNYSVGLVARPMSGLSATLDLYEIKIKNRILQSATLGPSAAVSAALASQRLNPQQAAFYYANAADTDTKGIDFVADYTTDLGSWGSVKWTLSANYNHTVFDRVQAPPPALAAAGLVLVDRVRIGDLSVATPRDKEIFSADWTRDKLEVNLRVTRFGELTQRSTNPLLDERISPQGIVDLDVSYELFSWAKVSVGANNLFNTYPDVVQPANRGGANPFTYYNQYSPYGIAGGFFYGKVVVKF